MNYFGIFKHFWVVALIIGLIIALWGINLPHVGLYNANNNYLALASKNFLRFGFEQLHFLPTYHVGAQTPELSDRYLHHPVLMFLISPLTFALFGDGNWVVHVLPFIFTLASLAVLFVLVKEFYGESVARWTTLFALLFPMFGFFWKLN
jgi:4-amino-4-deoxy-L-arabinose transferase-like glycosyltransferase